MPENNEPGTSETAVAFLTRALAAQSGLDAEALEKEAKAEAAQIAQEAGVPVNDYAFTLSAAERDALAQHILTVAEQEGGSNWKPLVEESREGAEYGALDAGVILATGAAIGFVLLCAKLKRLDLVKKVIDFGPMPDKLAGVLEKLAGLPTSGK